MFLFCKFIHRLPISSYSKIYILLQLLVLVLFSYPRKAPAGLQSKGHGGISINRHLRFLERVGVRAVAPERQRVVPAA